MQRYQFKTQQFGITGDEIHLLRNGFNYEQIKFSEINTIVIEEGREINNWLLILLLGIVLVIPGIYVLVNIGNVWNYENYKARQMWGILMLLLMPVTGGYFIFNALQMSVIFRIRYRGGRSKRYSLREIQKSGELESFKKFIRINSNLLSNA